MRQLFLFGLVILLGACSTAESSTPAPTPTSVQVIYPSTLQAWVDKLSRCASSEPFTAIYTFQTENVDPVIFSDKIVLMFGEPSQVDASANLWKVGEEQIVVIVNRSNDLHELSSSQVQSIFSGQSIQWEDEADSPIQVWVLVDKDPARRVFDRAITQPQNLTTNAMLAPDSAAMLEAVSGEEGAIGYLPYSVLKTADPILRDKVRQIKLDSTLENELTQPVLAATLGEPLGPTRDMLACLQASAP